MIQDRILAPDLSPRTWCKPKFTSRGNSKPISSSSSKHGVSRANQSPTTVKLASPTASTTTTSTFKPISPRATTSTRESSRQTPHNSMTCSRPSGGPSIRYISPASDKRVEDNPYKNTDRLVTVAERGDHKKASTGVPNQAVERLGYYHRVEHRDVSALRSDRNPLIASGRQDKVMKVERITSAAPHNASAVKHVSYYPEGGRAAPPQVNAPRATMKTASFVRKAASMAQNPAPQRGRLEWRPTNGGRARLSPLELGQSAAADQRSPDKYSTKILQRDRPEKIVLDRASGNFRSGTRHNPPREATFGQPINVCAEGRTNRYVLNNHRYPEPTSRRHVVQVNLPNSGGRSEIIDRQLVRRAQSPDAYYEPYRPGVTYSSKDDSDLPSLRKCVFKALSIKGSDAIPFSLCKIIGKGRGIDIPDSMELHSTSGFTVDAKYDMPYHYTLTKRKLKPAHCLAC